MIVVVVVVSSPFNVKSEPESLRGRAYFFFGDRCYQPFAGVSLVLIIFMLIFIWNFFFCFVYVVSDFIVFDVLLATVSIDLLASIQFMDRFSAFQRLCYGFAFFSRCEPSRFAQVKI